MAYGVSCSPSIRTGAALIFCGGDKSGGSEKLFYRQMIAKADDRFDAHLAQVEAEKKKKKKGK
jgi:hypothetical protein